MSIIGRQITALAPYGGPGKPEGPLNFIFIFPLTFQLQVAGLSSNDFESDEDFQQCQVNTSGIKLIVVVLDANRQPINVRDNQGLIVKIQYPNGTSQDFVGKLLDNGLDGAFYYTTFSTDLTQVGRYQIQGKLVLNNTPISTRKGTFLVGENINDS